jgi:hypothetical protein
MSRFFQVQGGKMKDLCMFTLLNFSSFSSCITKNNGGILHVEIMFAKLALILLNSVFYSLQQ